MRLQFNEIFDLWAGDHHTINLFFCIDRELPGGIRKISYIDQTKGFCPKSGYVFGFQQSYFLYSKLKSARADLVKLKAMTNEKFN